jgi:hypothetical protein
LILTARVKLYNFCIVLLAIIASSAHAHHSMPARYDMGRTIEIKGVVAEFKFRSPHAWLILDVANDAGNVERWRIESSAVPTLRRAGFRKDTFAEGDRVTVMAWPSKKSKPRAFGFSFVTQDGKTLVAMRKRGKGITIEKKLSDIMKTHGRWRSIVTPVDVELQHELPRAPLHLTPAGLKAKDNYDPALSPASTCTPFNLPAIFYGPAYLLDIRIDSKEVVIAHEFYGVTRKVVLNSEPRKTEKTGLFGASTGRIEGD